MKPDQLSLMIKCSQIVLRDASLDRSSGGSIATALIIDDLKARIDSIEPGFTTSAEFQPCLSLLTERERIAANAVALNAELADLTDNPKRAYENFLKHKTACLAERKKLSGDLESIQQKLQHLGVETQSANTGWGRSLLAVLLAIGLAIALAYFAIVWGKGEVKTEASISYDVGKMIEALLLGSGALIAGVAYAASTLRNRLSGRREDT